MWTNIPKPTGTNYTNVNPNGKTQYDQADLIYDDPNVFYDGVNPNEWTDVNKPVIGYGNYIWNQMTMTWDSVTGNWDSGWVNVNKPT